MSGARDWILSHTWAITPESFQSILSIAERDLKDVEAITAKRDRYLENAARVRSRDGVAILDVFGPLFARANMFMEISGATSYEMLAKEFQIAMDDPKIHSIVLQLDSPGGEVSGNYEFSELVFNARKKKPIYAFVQHSAASAAYWIASSANKIILAETAMVGSIGTIMAWKEQADPQNVKKYEFISSVSPNKKFDPDTEKGKAQIQKVVDDMANVFVKYVARNRGVSLETVQKDFGQGGVLIGESAIKAGMADEIGTLEGVIATLISKPQQRHGGFHMETNPANPVAPVAAAPAPVVTAESLKISHPSVYASIFLEGKTQGIQAENSRIKAIEEIKTPGAAAVIAAHKFNPEMSKKEIAVLILDEQAKTQATANADRLADGTATAAQAVAAGSPDAPATSAPAQAKEKERAGIVKAAAAAMDAANGFTPDAKA